MEGDIFTRPTSVIFSKHLTIALGSYVEDLEKLYDNYIRYKWEKNAYQKYLSTLSLICFRRNVLLLPIFHYVQKLGLDDRAVLADSI